MTTSQLEKRVAALEAEVANLKTKPKNLWWNKIAGAFADNPDFDEAMRLGRAAPDPYRPGSRRPGKRRVKSKAAK